MSTSARARVPRHTDDVADSRSWRGWLVFGWTTTRVSDRIQPDRQNQTIQEKTRALVQFDSAPNGHLTRVACWRSLHREPRGSGPVHVQFGVPLLQTWASYDNRCVVNLV